MLFEEVAGATITLIVEQKIVVIIRVLFTAFIQAFD